MNPLRLRPFTLVTLLSAASSCGPALEWRWAEPTTLAQADAAHYPKSVAAVLLHHLRIRQTVDGSGFVVHAVQHHEIIKVLTEQGMKLAEWRLPVARGARLADFHARRLGRGGGVFDLDADRMLTTEAHTAGEDRRQVEIHLFRFPGVQVGDSLELIYTVQDERIKSIETSKVSGSMPVLDYRADVEVSDRFRLEAQAQGPDPLRIDQSVDDRAGLLRVTVTGRDIPPIDEQPIWAAPAAERATRWSYRLLEFQGRRLTIPLAYSWANVVKGIASRLYFESKRLFAGVTLGIPSQDCDERCRIRASLEWLRERTWYSGGGPVDARPQLKEVLASGRANHLEQALLLWGQLVHSGIQAQFALVARDSGVLADGQFPDLDQFDHLLLRLPEQPGIAEPLWIDPACAHCGMSQIPGYLQNARALWFSATPDTPFYPATSTAGFGPVRGELAAPDRDVRSYRAELDGEANLKVSMIEEERGDSATRVDQRAHAWPAERWKQEAQTFVSHRAATGRLDQETPPRCERAQGICRRNIRFTLPAYATTDGERLLVPLNLFWSPWDGAFTEPKRTAGFLVPDDHTEEVIELQPPPGHAVDALPPPLSMSSAIADITAGATVAGGLITIRRAVARHGGRYEPSAYPELQRAMLAFTSYRQNLIVLRKTQRP